MAIKLKENENPLISIIVTSYNYEDYIEKTLTSITNQTYKNIEIIVVDDGSTDNSISVINSFKNNKNNIYLLKHKNNLNMGLKESIKLALTKATGEFIAFCESDDYWNEEYLQEKMCYFTNNPTNIIVANKVTPFGENIYFPYVIHANTTMKKFKNEENVFKLLENENIIPTFSCVMLKANILKKCDFNSPIDAWLDWWLWRQISAKHSIGFIDKHLTYWRRHKKNYILRNEAENEEKKEDFIKKSNEVIQRYLN